MYKCVIPIAGFLIMVRRKKLSRLNPYERNPEILSHAIAILRNVSIHRMVG